MIIFDEEYDGECISDLTQDIDDVLAIELPILPKDKDGLYKGTFKIKIVWSEDA
jgi:hypothetical protein